MMRRVATTIAMMLACATTAAQTAVEDEAPEYPRYTVEVIIFEYAEEVSVGTEVFLPEEPPLPDAEELAATEPVFSDAVPAPAPGEPEPELEGPEFVIHLEDEYTLSDIAARLQRLDVYRPLMHVAWTQVTRPEEETQPIELRALAEPPEGLDGSFTLYLSRYLHLVVDLTLEPRSGTAEPISIDEPAAVFRDSRRMEPYDDMQTGPLRFRISEDRIFKSGDLRYFDHPKFGVLAKITRVEEPEEEEIETGLVGQRGE
jgi:hypothetical protein